MALKSVFLARSCGESWLKVKNVKGNTFLSFEGKSRDSNISELYTVHTEQCLGIETYFTTIGNTWCSARSLSLITTHASNLSLNLLLKKSTISFSVTQAPVMIIRGVLHSECLSSKGAVLVTHFCDLVILGNKHA